MIQKEKTSVLVVDDDQASLNAINRALRRDFQVILSRHANAALEVLKTEEISVIVADQRMPDISGVELFQKAQHIQRDAIRILITGYTDIEAIIQAINEGKIYYYITKPWEPEDLRLIVRRAAEMYFLQQENKRLMEELRLANERLEQENIILQQEAVKRFEFENIIGQSSAMQEVFRLLRKVIPTNITVLLIGETGTGKELIARAIHYNGLRKDNLFVAQNCSAMPDTLLESELFGHTKGAFTGAYRDKKGLFELADEGTIFLDEISDTSPAFQQRLLRVLQEGEIRPLGSEKTLKTDVRIISATNKNLETFIEQGNFREDLYYRLNVFPIRIPPLRERREDIPLLVDHFIRKYEGILGKKVKGIQKDALTTLMAAPYTGNVRELENEIQRALTLADPNSFIKPEHLSDRIKEQSSQLQPVLTRHGSLKEITESVEKHYIMETLKKNNGNITHSARDLGLSRVGLQKKLHRYGIKVK